MLQMVQGWISGWACIPAMPFSLAASRAAAVENLAAAALSSTLFFRLSSSIFLRCACCSCASSIKNRVSQTHNNHLKRRRQHAFRPLHLREDVALRQVYLREEAS